MSTEIINRSTCRFCLQKIKSKRYKIGKNVTEKYSEITQKELICHPSFPKFICSDCWKPLNLFHVYKINLIENQAVLNKIFNVSDNQDPVKEEGPLFVKVEIENTFLDIDESVTEQINKVEIKTEKTTQEPDETFDDFHYSDDGGEFLDQHEKDNLETTLVALAQDNKMLQNKFYCLECGVFVSKGFKVHRDEVHLKIKKYFCDFCGHGTFRKNDLRDHMQIHNRDKRMKCPECKILCRSRRDLFQHRVSNHGYSSKEQQRLNRISKILCQECGKYISKPHFRMHQSRVHLKIKKFTCDICGHKYYRKTELKEHIEMHSDLKKYKCSHPDCNKMFRIRHSMRDHYRREHLGQRRTNNRKYRYEKKFNCKLCSASFECKSKLKDHVKIHSDAKEFSCEICGDQFKTKTQLHSHSRRHMEPKFSCEICQKKFHSLTPYQNHMRSHTGSRDFGCSYCDMKYFSNAHLNRHIKNHHMKIKFSCELPGCSSQFARKETYRNHVISHHKDLGPEKLNVFLKKITETKQKLDSSTFRINNLKYSS